MFERMIRCLVICNHNDCLQASPKSPTPSRRSARIAFYIVLAGKQCGIAVHRVMKSRLRQATISRPRAGQRPLAETVQPLPKEQESHRVWAPTRGLKTGTKAWSGTSARQQHYQLQMLFATKVGERSISRWKSQQLLTLPQTAVLSIGDRVVMLEMISPVRAALLPVECVIVVVCAIVLLLHFYLFPIRC